MESKNKNNRFKNIINDLNSGDKKKVLTALKQLRKHGKAEAFKHIINVYKSQEDESVKEAITALLFDLKDESVVPEIINAIESETDEDHKAFLLSILWQSSLDSSEFIENLVRIGVAGNFMICFEVITIIEQYEGAFYEEDINNLILDIDEELMTEPEGKIDVLNSLKSVLEGLTIEY